MKIALGPIQYSWPAEHIRAFYQKVASWPVDIVYLGEVVCSKRQELSLLEWLYVADMLSEAGKEVVLSSLAQLENEADLKSLQKICNNGDYKIEANNRAAIQFADGRPFIAGPYISRKHHGDLSELQQHGAVRWVMPADYSASKMQKIQNIRPDNIETEVFVYGDMPLSVSTTCFSAQVHHLMQEDCQLVCKKYPEGMKMLGQNVENAIILNGFQIQSGVRCNLIGEIGVLQSAGIEVIRISPQLQQMQQVIEKFSVVINAGKEDKACLDSGNWCNGFWYAGEERNPGF